MSGHWRWIKLSHAFPRIGSGTTPPDEQENYAEDSNGINWVTTSELRETDIKSTKKQVSHSALKRYPTLRLYEPGSIMFAMYGATIGRLGILGAPACCNQACCVFEKSRIVSNRYLFYWLWHRRSDLVAISVGGGQPNLSQQDLRNEKIFCPELETQKAIADFLDRETACIDQLIEKKQRQIELINEQFLSEIHSTVANGLKPGVSTMSSGLPWFGDVPSHWQMKPLRHVVLFQRGHDLPSDDRKPGSVPVVSSGGVSSEHDTAIAKGPGIVTGRYGTIGSFYFVEGSYWPLNTTLYSKRIFEEPRYVWYLLQDMAHIFILNSSKSAVPGVDRNDLHSERVPVPPQKEQAIAVDYLEQKLKQKEQIASFVGESVERLREFRAAVITAAVTGQIDVTTWGREGQTDRRLDQIEEAMHA